MQALLAPNVVDVLKTLELEEVNWDTTDACEKLA